MASFKSQTNTVPAPVGTVYAKLSDFSNLDNFAENIPAELRDKADFEVKDGLFTIKTQQIGDISFMISKKIENRQVTLETISGSSPMPFAIDIMMNEQTEQTTELYVETRIELNPIIKAMLAKPIQDRTDKFAQLLTTVKY